MLILSIPFLNPGFVKKHSRNTDFEWKEFRLDYNKKLQDFPLEILDQKSIVTIRYLAEGGKNHFPKNERIAFFQKAIQNSNCLVDFEIQKYKEDLIQPENLILSYHDFSNDCDFEKLENIIFKSNHLKAKFFKFSIQINKYSQLLKIEKIIIKSNKPVIFAGMGKLGKISRFLHKHLGAEGTFIGMKNHPTAFGQLTEKDVEIYYLDSINSSSKIGGIIGGKQIQHSLGLKFYNEYFWQNKIDAFYFPFVINDISNFKELLQKCKFKNKFFGFSITMPFKQKIAEKNETFNLYLPKTNRFLNTDKFAFQIALNKLKIKRNDKILVFGFGGSAHAVLEVLADFKNVHVFSRSAENSGNYISLNETKKQTFDLLINCTPIGMKGEDFVAEVGIQSFKKVIDLPYQNENTKLVKFCKKNKIPYVDGKQFWKWQAERQLQEFKREIRESSF